MNATTLPTPTNFSPLSLFAQQEQAIPLPRVERVRASGPVLRNGPPGTGEDVKSLHLTSGWSPSLTADPGTGTAPVRLVADAAERLYGELSATRERPRAVQLCPTGDPFPAALEAQLEAARVVEVLARHDVQAWFLTRGFIRPAALGLLAAHADRLRVMVGLTTLDRKLQRVLEPGAPPPQLRLKLIRKLRELGVPVQVALEPLVPGLTDDRETLRGLLAELAEVGVTRVCAGYLYLPPGTPERAQRALRPFGWDALVLDAYADGPLYKRPGLGLTRFLAKSRRQRGYAALMSLAAGFGITVTLSPTGNPDFTRTPPPPRQRVLA